MLNEKLKDIIEEVLSNYVKEYQNPDVENHKYVRCFYKSNRIFAKLS